MLTHKELKKQYANKHLEVNRRLDDFAFKGKNMNNKDMFLELCFCICTPQSKAVKVAEIMTEKNINNLLTLDNNDLAEFLRRNTRFHNNKAAHIIHARQYVGKLKNLDKDSSKAREFLVKNVKGIGYKEASHYLRNIGYRNLCIIDRHVINLMHELRVFSDAKNPSTPKKYLEMEQKIKDYAKKYNYDVDELDLVLWSIKTGHVFK
jgi:N-glycosylase/DNA lyase